MEKRWKDRKRIMAAGGVWTVWGGVCWILGVVFAVLGVVGEAMNITLGLEPMSWLLLAIAAFVASIPEYLGWAVAVYLSTAEAKSEKEE